MTFTFYYGLHPISWFILIANVVITVVEWQFLVSQFIKLQKEENERS